MDVYGFVFLILGIVCWLVLLFYFHVWLWGTFLGSVRYKSEQVYFKKVHFKGRPEDNIY